MCNTDDGNLLVFAGGSIGCDEEFFVHLSKGKQFNESLSFIDMEGIKGGRPLLENSKKELRTFLSQGARLPTCRMPLAACRSSIFE